MRKNLFVSLFLLTSFVFAEDYPSILNDNTNPDIIVDGADSHTSDLNPAINQTERVYVKVNLQENSTQNIFEYKNFIIDSNIYEREITFKFKQENSKLWSIETIISDIKLAKVSINGQFTTSNIVLMQFNPEGKLAWLTDIAGNRVVFGDAYFNLHLLYPDGKEQILIISLGSIGEETAITLTSSPSEVSSFTQDGKIGDF